MDETVISSIILASELQRIWKIFLDTCGIKIYDMKSINMLQNDLRYSYLHFQITYSKLVLKI